MIITLLKIIESLQLSLTIHLGLRSVSQFREIHSHQPPHPHLIPHLCIPSPNPLVPTQTFQTQLASSDPQTLRSLLSRFRASSTMSSSCRMSFTMSLMLLVSFRTSTLWVYGSQRTVNGRQMVFANSLQTQQSQLYPQPSSTFYITVALQLENHPTVVLCVVI